MATIRKIIWENANGKKSQRFQLTYMDANGKRRRKQFATKSEAEAENQRIASELRGGTHVADNDSRTVQEGCNAFLSHKEKLMHLGKRERVTTSHYKTHINLHIAATSIAGRKLSRLSPSDIQIFAEDLESDLSHELAVKVYATLRMAVNYCRRRGWISHNPCDGIKIERPRRYEKKEIKIPAKDDLKALLQKASETDITGRSSAFLRLMLFQGLRISEVRGLPRNALKLEGKTPTVEIFQRADDYCQIGRPKSAAAYRTLSLSPDDVLILKKWILSCGAKDEDLLFATGSGRADSYQNITSRWWKPLMEKAELLNKRKKPRFTPHQLRHAFASLHIEQGTQPKQLQTMMGHSSIKITMDTYGHLWEDAHAGHALAIAIERNLG